MRAGLDNQTKATVDSASSLVNGAEDSASSTGWVWILVVVLLLLTVVFVMLFLWRRRQEKQKKILSSLGGGTSHRPKSQLSNQTLYGNQTFDAAGAAYEVSESDGGAGAGIYGDDKYLVVGGAAGDTVCRTADLIYAVPVDEAGTDVAGSVYVSPNPHASGGYQTLENNGAYATRLPTGSELPYDTRAESSVNGIPSETGSLVLIATTDEGAISPDQGYVEVDVTGRADDTCATA